MTHRQATFVAMALLALIVVFRTFVSGWSPPDAPPASASTVFGVTAHPADNLSYSAWAQQARSGLWRFGILYTTSEHEPLMFNSLFLLIGKLSALFGVSPLLVLNVLGALSLPVFVFAFSSMCRRLGLGSAATFAATCLALGGGGISWIRKSIDWLGINQVLPVGPPGPDLSFYDVYPVVAYFVSPYHAIAFGIVGVLVLLLVRLDDLGNRLTASGLALLGGVGLLLATVRPHIAIMVLAAYCAATAASFAFKLEPTLRRRRTIVATCLAGAMLMPVLYSVWVSQQPVWSDFSRAHRPDTHDWGIGFFVLWILAGAGVALLGLRALRSPFAFLIAWALGSGFLLVVLNGYLYPKLTYGFTIALAAIAGVAIDQYAQRTRSPAKLGAAVAAISVLALASPLVLVHPYVRDEATTVRSELLKVVDAIGADSATLFPTVLADCGTGVLLPGLGGHRVFCGHWALTKDNRQKIVLLSRLGFLADNQAMPTFADVRDVDVAMGARLLHDQIAGDTFQYLAAQKTFRIHKDFAAVPAHCVVHDGPQYRVLRMCAEVKNQLETMLRARVQLQS